MKPNNPQSTAEYTKHHNNFSYDARLKNLQKSLISANKLDNNIRKELYDDERSIDSEEDEQNIDEIEPQVELYKYKKNNQLRDSTDRLHIPREGPYSKKNQTKESIYVLKLDYSGSKKGSQDLEVTGDYSVNDVSAMSKNEGGSVRFSTM